jgi:excisionase family DNA binding protein
MNNMGHELTSSGVVSHFDPTVSRARGHLRAARLDGHRSVTTSLPVPHLLTPDEVAGALRTTKKAIYAMIERAQLPGVVRIGRRVLVREDVLLDWLRQKAAPSPER